MIRRMLHSRLPLMVYSPVKVFDKPYFKTVFKAGGLPVFDAEFSEHEQVLEHLQSLAKEDISFGIRLAEHDRDLIAKISRLNLLNLDCLICPVSEGDDTADFKGFRDTKILLEIREININDKIKKISPHGLVLKGNEASGKVSHYSSFILMQWYLKNSRLPVFIQGGVGKYTAAGMFSAGASGVVLDSQLFLTDQAPVSAKVKSLIQTLDESDSTQIEYTSDNTSEQSIYRVFAKLGTKIVKDLKQKAVELGPEPDSGSRIYQFIKENMADLKDEDTQFIQSLFYLGQDGIFARDFIKESTDLEAVIPSFFKEIGARLNLVDQHDPVVEGSDFAKGQGTRFPLIQGPMANISDNADFAEKVLEGGALPFFAVGSLPENLADAMLKKGSEKVPVFGAGLVGIEAFNPAVKIHLELVKKYRAPYALFAGGIPSQVIELEEAGTKTYLHTPSISMMDNAIKNGCRRFIFEGGEAGGHVGYLSSMVLWEHAIAYLVNRDWTDSPVKLSDLSLVFAGGISTRFASFFLSGMSAFLASKGVKIGLQVGTAYLFSNEIVDTKAVKSQYRDILIKENKTIVMGKTLGLASRTAPTPFARMMIENEKEMMRNRESLDKRKRAFEKNNIGSLLIGAKGFLPDFKHPGPENYTWFDGEEHRAKGNFLTGDSLAFFDSSITISDIHTCYFGRKSTLYKNLNNLEIFSSDRNRIHDEIAVIGIGCTLPHADDPEALWQNILDKRYSIEKVPESRFDYDLYYDPDKNAEDKTYTTLAGHVDHFVFDGERFGYPEDKARRLSRSQQMVLQTACKAVEHSGLLGENDQFVCEDPTRTAVVIATCLSNDLGNDIQLKYWYPEILSMLEKTSEYKNLDETEKQQVRQTLQEGMEGDNPGYDPVHGILLNIEASRIARHLGIRGANYIVDAACASSVTAVEAAIGELLSGDHDQVIAGGVNTHLAPEPFVGFSKMGTLSARGSFPFDERADGFVLGEGSVVFVLKRMKDALRDKNRIYGIINSVGASSDGRGKAIAAPSSKGQKLSIKRCYENIRPDITPAHIGFIEAHGTSTIIGDEAELQTLNSIYRETRAGISSIKSQIGHLLGAAGAAGLLKALLAVNKGMLPPNGRFETLSKNHDLNDSSLFIVKDALTWEAEKNQSRKAAVSSYGFGGINYHAVVEQMTENYKQLERHIFADPSYDYNDDRIVVAGLGVFLPGAKNKEEFWEKLVSGEKQLSHIPEDRFDNDAYASFDKKSNYRIPKVNAGMVKEYKFNNLKYRMPPMMVKSVERGQLFGLEAAGEAIETSGLSDQITAGNKIGVILGTIAGERQSKNIIRVRKQFLGNLIKNCEGLDEQKRNAISDQLVEHIRKTIPENNEDTTPGLLSNLIAGRIANFFDLNGPSYVIDASCASAFIAMRNAARNIKHKDLDFVLAGGVDCNLYPAVLMAFKRIGLLSEDQCHFYDSRAQGYVMGEGAAIHVMTTYKKARQHHMEILGEINDYAVRSSVPDHLLSPSGPVFASTIDEAYEKSGIRKQDVEHLDVFAFSNVFGDLVEKQVIEQCFEHEIYCGNVKSQFGYFKAANPAVAAAKIMLMNKYGRILPNYNYDADYSTLNDSRVLKPALQMVAKPMTSPMRFASNVNGIGGNHCHMIMGTLPLRLDDARKAASAGVKRDAEKEKIPVLNYAAHSYSSDQRGRKLRIVALLSGQGAQRSHMMKDLFDKDPHIRSIMEHGEKIFAEQRGYSLLDLMFGTDDAINSTQNTQPAVFLSSAALYSRLAMEGFSPDYFIGHSVGEYTALYCSGMLGFEDAMRLIIKRSDLMYESTVKVPGRIMVVFKNEKETESLIRKSFISNIYITNKNSEKQTGVSGKEEDIDKFCEFLKSEGVFHKKLNLTGAFHTPLLKDAAGQLRRYLDTVTFNETRFGRIISNTTATAYPEMRNEVKDLLARQIISPVEFIRSVENVYEAGRTHFIEIGPSRLLVNLLKNINIIDYETMVSVDDKKGEIQSFQDCRNYLLSHNAIFEAKAVPAVQIAAAHGHAEKVTARIDHGDDFQAFKQNNQELVDQILYKEYLAQKREKAIDAIERFEFNTSNVIISGVSVGLPGKARKVFASDNFDAILNGENFIEPITTEMQNLMIDKNITKLYKQPDGNARFVQITKTEDVIHLAGQLGYFDLTDEYGIKQQYDIAMAIAMAAGIEALKDANIPLVMQYKEMKGGRTMVPDGFALPKEMQDETGVIISSLWPNGETLMSELEKYFYEKMFLKPYEEFENIYYFLMEKVQDMEVKEKLTEWFFRAKSRKRSEVKEYKFDRNFLSNACPLGSAHLAQIIKAKGPNTLVSSACASTTLAIGIAEDWIRVGRCKRVLVVGGENTTSNYQAPWVGGGFLALGAATIKKRVSEAAKPFDEDRNGTILGAGAVGLVIESETCAKQRGMNGQCRILGTHIANSAYHTYNIDVPHMAGEMDKFVRKVEKRNHLEKKDYADKLLFMSHETFTPARGGSADAEVTALKQTFAQYLDRICISNTKGFTGHTLGAAIEDVVLVKALQKRKAPPIANLKKIPEHFRTLNFSGQGSIDCEYGIHLSAGFGSHCAFMFVKRIEENQVEGNEQYMNWLRSVTGSRNPELKLIDNMLCAVAGGDSVLETIPEPKKFEIPAKMPVPAAAEKPAVQKGVPKLELPEKEQAPTVDAISIEPAADTGISDIIKKIIAEQTGYTVDMLEDDLDLEADLGVDTVKQVEIFAKIASHFGFNVPDDLKLRDLNTIAKLGEYISGRIGKPAPEVSASAERSPSEQASVHAASDVPGKIKEVIAEQTGYTVDMLEDDLDLEADLGVDTVKQVEIFAKIASHFGFAVPDDLKLRDLNTIAKLGEYISGRTGKPMPEAVSTAEDQAVVQVEPVSGRSASDVLGKVKEVISGQTGYTVDMLEDDLDLEADLGVDTVKQVEIFAKIASHFGFAVPDDLKLRDLNTIAKLGGYITSRFEGAESPDQDAVDAQEPVQQGSAVQEADLMTRADKDQTAELPDPESPVKRLVVKVKESDLHKPSGRDFQGVTFAVTLDSHGFAQSIIREVVAKKGKVVTLGKEGGDFEIDLGNPAEVEKQMDEFKKLHPEVNGILYLAPLDSCLSSKKSGSSDDVQALKSAIDSGIKSFFVMIKALYDRLDTQKSIIGSLSFDSVIFPYLGEACNDIHPLSAGISGFMKTINKELEKTRVKMVDFSYKQPKRSIPKVAQTFTAELLSEDEACEVGYKNGRRFLITMKPAAARREESMIKPGDRLLVTGGAGGITFEILKKVVSQYRTDLIILGTSDIKGTDSKYLDRSLGQPQLMAMLKKEMTGAKPVEIKNRLDRILRIRKTADNIAYLKKLGITVDYHSADVRDPDAVKSIVQKYDRIDGILHAAGVERSQFIPKKELVDFETVLDVKIKGVHNLLTAMKEKAYRYFFAFSSVTARFGNEGQADYTAANDYLGKVLFREKQLHPDRVYKVFSWTAWEGAGMATNSTVQKVLEERGIKFLPLNQGVKFFMADLRDPDELETVFSGLDYSFDRDGILGGPANMGFPFLDDLVESTRDSATFSRLLEIKRDRFLEDHTMGDVPLFLGATGIETMAEVAGTLSKENEKFVELNDFHIPYGIKLLKKRPKKLMISGKRNGKGIIDCSIISVFKNPMGVVMGEPKLHYEGKYRFEHNALKPKKIQIPEFSPVTYEGDLETLVYNPRRLFMFGLFATIKEVNSFDGDTLITTVRDSSSQEFFKGDKNPRFVSSPVLIDAMFQTGGLFEFFTTSRTVLPFKIKSFKIYKDVAKNEEYYCITRKTESGEETNVYDLKLVDKRGDVHIEIDRFEMVRLNRIEPEDRIADRITFKNRADRIKVN